MAVARDGRVHLALPATGGRVLVGFCSRQAQHLPAWAFCRIGLPETEGLSQSHTLGCVAGSHERLPVNLQAIGTLLCTGLAWPGCD